MWRSGRTGGGSGWRSRRGARARTRPGTAAYPSRWDRGGSGRPAEALRRAARREKDGRAAAGMDAIEPRVEGLRRAEAARLAGMERQALRDAVVRTTNAEGLVGLHDRPKGRPRRRLDAKEEAALAAAIARGPDPDADGGSCLDAGRPVPLAGGRARQDLPPVEHDPGAAPARLLARDRRGPITPNAMPRRRRPSKRGARRAGGRHRGAPSRQADRAVAFPRGSGRHQGPGPRHRRWRRRPSARRACSNSATSGPPSSPRSAPPPARTSRGCCRP